MVLLRRLFGTPPVKDPLTKVGIDDDSLVYEGLVDGARTWRNRNGDGIGLYHFAVPPDLPKRQASMEDFRAAFQSIVDQTMLDVQTDRIADMSVVRTIAKVLPGQARISYVGSYIIPFRDCSYVVKIQCDEHGVTGMREAILLARGLSRGEVTFEGSELKRSGTSPYDVSHDSEFPDHPLSRCRRGLRRLGATLTLADELRKLPKFALPGGG